MNQTDDDNSFIADALPTFISEAHEHIEMFEQLLLQLETQPDNRELLDALFRSAHTIKGSAGLFGLEQVVAFTHHLETLLDQVRETRQPLTPALSTLLLQCNDQIRLLVDAIADPQSDTDATAPTRESLVEQLRRAYTGTSPAAPASPQESISETESASHWKIAVAFGIDTFRNGMDPLAIINYVEDLGAVERLVCDTTAVPPLDTLNAEDCHLTFDFMLNASVTRETIAAAFSFVRDDCELKIEAVPSSEVTSAIASLPEGLRIGEILVGVGAITNTQLHSGLKTQAEVSSRSGAPTLLGEVLLNNTQLHPAVLAAALEKQQKTRGSNGKSGTDDNRFIRVQADRLDDVINLLGELVIATAGASLLAHQSRSKPLLEANRQIANLVEEIRNGTLQLRMVPVGETFARFRRVVRDTAAELGKDIAMEIIGGETELDKSVVERITDPLMHLVRNALDHGIETPEQRCSAGKSAQGKLMLSARHESGSILICISDDGRGIDRERVLARAWKCGLVEAGVRPADSDILKLIFEPGFSTAETITNLSGRGVGMDVVQRNIEALRGTINLFSTEGEGSRIEIRLPLTLAIIDGFLVSVGQSKFIFPLDGVVEVIERQASDMVVDAQGRSIVELRNQVLPVVCLRTLYALDSPGSERGSIVVIQAGTRRYGVLVEQLHGQHQTVIKPLGKIIGSLRGVSGSSILGNGEVALIFDVHSLCKLAEQPVPPSFATSVSHSESITQFQSAK